MKLNSFSVVGIVLAPGAFASAHVPIGVDFPASLDTAVADPVTRTKSATAFSVYPDHLPDPSKVEKTIIIAIPGQTTITSYEKSYTTISATNFSAVVSSSALGSSNASFSAPTISVTLPALTSTSTHTTHTPHTNATSTSAVTTRTEVTTSKTVSVPVSTTSAAAAAPSLATALGLGGFIGAAMMAIL
ncbi:hypothetical protein MBM_09246 [Drepanopeziza brunnea f. sp. 'multigermtubi' MB_m1]|uniref:GPI anchored protein n=1 Tax=Marssonina brunnea f. sp. multigermtubi (strain MB_m1) TaxID=1072389 RepID=K1WKE4_MARBU|nr:uncharacterized protein MBM_09246 [Drepanopeziza brunnea f. sp. 'multigermtubi' MB_m1]EKD12677.1 hypothetical protein MBM_09246 [Drepanopeziza brunnea f. sp. 'multigermtubi' MB_m1]